MKNNYSKFLSLKVNDKVRITKNKSNQKNKFHPKYINQIGEIIEKQGSFFKLKICFKRKFFFPLISPDQLILSSN